MPCQLCDETPRRRQAQGNAHQDSDREVKKLTEHHLVPRQTVKRNQAESGETLDICSPCHRQIQSFYTNLELAKYLNTIDKLQSEPNMRKFLNWVKKQDPKNKVRIKRK